MESKVSKLVAVEQIDGWALRKPTVKVKNLKPTPAAYTIQRRQFTGKIDSHRRDVNTPNIQPTARQPDSTLPTSTRKFKCIAPSWKNRLELGPYRRGPVCLHSSRSPCGVPLIPAATISFAHRRVP